MNPVITAVPSRNAPMYAQTRRSRRASGGAAGAAGAAAGELGGVSTGGILCQMLADLREKGPRAERLRHVVVTPRLVGLDVVAGERVRRDRDQRDRAQGRVRLDPPRRLVAVDPG